MVRLIKTKDLSGRVLVKVTCEESRSLLLLGERKGSMVSCADGWVSRLDCSAIVFQDTATSSARKIEMYAYMYCWLCGSYTSLLVAPIGNVALGFHEGLVSSIRWETTGNSSSCRFILCLCKIKIISDKSVCGTDLLLNRQNNIRCGAALCHILHPGRQSFESFRCYMPRK